MNKIKKKRIAVLTTVHDPNDTRIYHRQIPSLIKLGYEVLYLCKEYPKTENGAKVVLLPSFGNKYVRVLFAPLAAFWKAITLKNVDLYHFHDPELMITGLLLKLFGKKVIYDVHEDLPKQLLSNDWLPKWLLKPVSMVADFLEIFLSTFFDHIITVTKPIAKRFPDNKTTIVQNFPGSDELMSEEAKPYLKRAKNIIYVGEASDIRGMRELVIALEHLDDSVRLILIGRISTVGLEDELKTYPGWSKVDFLGLKTRKEVAKYLGQSRLGIVCFYPEPNHIEAQPNKLFEYMSVGIPVVASYFPKWQEIVDKHKTGLTVNPLNVDEIVKAIKYLFENEHDAQTMGENGRELIRSHYSWEAEERQLRKAYNIAIKYGTYNA